jgi:hypothetical protein
MFGEQRNEQIEGMGGRQQSQKVDAEELGGGEKTTPPWPGALKEKRVDQIVWNVWRQPFQ